MDAQDVSEIEKLAAGLRKPRLLQSFDLQEEIRKTNERNAIEAAAQAYLSSRLTALDAENMPVRYDPPIIETTQVERPLYFYSGAGKNNSRVAYKRTGCKRFGRR